MKRFSLCVLKVLGNAECYPWEYLFATVGTFVGGANEF